MRLSCYAEQVTLIVWMKLNCPFSLRARVSFQYRHITSLQEGLCLWPAFFLLRNMILTKGSCVCWDLLNDGSRSSQVSNLFLLAYVVPLIFAYHKQEHCRFFMVPFILFSTEGYKWTYVWRIQLVTHLLNSYSPCLISDQDTALIHLMFIMLTFTMFILESQCCVH